MIKAHGYKIIPIVAVFLIAIFGIGGFAHAEPSTGDMGTEIYVDSSLTFDITPRNVELNLNSANHPFDVSQDVNIIVGTNNTTGYKLIMSSDTGTNLINTANNATIPTLPNSTTGYTENDFINNSAYNNTWGYKQDGGNYMQFKSGYPIMDNSSAADRDTTTLNFAAKIDGNQLAGTYSIRLNFEVVVNPIPNYIQNLDPATCTTDYRTVIDNRDNQEYVIQRLADGKCWMMTNLNLGAINLTTDLTSANTNIRTTVPAATFNGWIKTGDTSSAARAWFIPVTNENSATGSDTDPVTGTKYGTLYNYCAASGGNSSACVTSMNSQLNYDICPAGWRLPINNMSISAGPTEFSELYNSAYNTLDKMRASYTSGGAAFTLAGEFSSDRLVPEYQGNWASYWSSTPYLSGREMIVLHISKGNVETINFMQGHRFTGYSIRCILKE